MCRPVRLAADELALTWSGRPKEAPNEMAMAHPGRQRLQPRERRVGRAAAATDGGMRLESSWTISDLPQTRAIVRAATATSQTLQWVGLRIPSDQL